MPLQNRKSYNYRMLIEYIGSAYSGWQRQPGLRTIQNELEQALQPVFGGRLSITSSGRTDAGVHALKQFCNFKSKVLLRPKKVMALLNGRLPKDISVRDVKLEKDNFDSRFSAKHKTYEYRIWTGYGRSVWNRYCLYVSKPLELSKMRKAAKLLLGTHDFSSFEAPRSSQPSKTVRMMSIGISKHENMVRLTFTADRFLYKMVRNIVGTLVDVGIGRLDYKEIETILKSKNRSNAGPTAPPEGLFLKEIYY